MGEGVRPNTQWVGMEKWTKVGQRNTPGGGHGETHMCRTDKSTRGRERVTHKGEGSEKHKIFLADRHMDGQMFI